jgi:hypothetical protein
MPTSWLAKNGCGLSISEMVSILRVPVRFEAAAGAVVGFAALVVVVEVVAAGVVGFAAAAAVGGAGAVVGAGAAVVGFAAGAEVAAAGTDVGAGADGAAQPARSNTPTRDRAGR